MSDAHAASYYADSAAPAALRPPLRGLVSAEVCVVGGGIAGCSAALHLAERGYSTVLLEQHRVGWGASGRSGGQVIHGVACGQGTLERLVGATAARAAWDLATEAVGLTRALIARYRIECDWVDGYMLTGLKPRHDRQLRAEIDELHRRYDYHSVRYMPREEVRAVLAGTRYLSAMFDANGGHLHPLAYTRGLATAAERAGARLFEGTRAVQIAPGCVRTECGEVHARRIVLCGNAYLGALAPALEEKIIPVATHLIATEPLGQERARALIANNAAVSDMNWALDYFRRTADHRLLFGGAISYGGPGQLAARAANRARMLRVFPQLAAARIEYTWGGLLDLTANRAPHFGRLAPEVYFLQGFSGHGIALAGIAGKLVAEALAGQAERFDVFARIPHRSFPGGALARRPLLALAMLYYRLRDLL
ncbi:MAG: NAD(P)/FAD-dependent oxidoreductase [Steroidobacteraceae bacterium]